MSYYEVTTCRLAIRLCIGYGPNGRKKHRTFSMKNINPNASWEGIMAVIRALAPVLEFPIVDVQKVTSRKIIFYEDAALPTPQEFTELGDRKIIPFPVVGRFLVQPAEPAENCAGSFEGAAKVAKSAQKAKILPFSSFGLALKAIGLPSNRAPPFVAA